MTQREVTDQKNTTWTCVQAYSSGFSNGSEVSPEVKNGNGTVTVVCTPSGGAQTVRLELRLDWLETISDNDLAERITAAK